MQNTFKFWASKSTEMIRPCCKFDKEKTWTTEKIYSEKDSKCHTCHVCLVQSCSLLQVFLEVVMVIVASLLGGHLGHGHCLFFPTDLF